MLGYALLSPALLRYALLLYDFASLCFLCLAWLSFDMPCHARICFAMSGYASTGYALLMLLMLLQTLQDYWYARIRLSRHYKNMCTHEFGPPKHYKNNGTHYYGAIFLEPESCAPILSRAGMLHTTSLLEKITFLGANPKFLDKMIV